MFRKTPSLSIGTWRWPGSISNSPRVGSGAPLHRECHELTPERWQQISRIFKSAISLDGEARHTYVAEKCGSDESLRSEVEKLIASHQQASEENFIGGRAAEKGAVLIIETDE